jgi:ankyrin repeat protein
MEAAVKGDTTILRLLVNAGADLESVNKSGETALAFAAYLGKTRALQMLMKSGASLHVHPHGHSLLEWCHKAGHNARRAIEVLKKAGLE